LNQFPDDEERDGSQNVGVFAMKTPDPAAEWPKIFIKSLTNDCQSRICYKFLHTFLVALLVSQGQHTQ
jgi:hypothetical protein